MNAGKWRKSSRSQGNADSNCVEARTAAAGYQMRDSKLGDASPVFDLDVEEFESLLRAAQR